MNTKWVPPQLEWAAALALLTLCACAAPSADRRASEAATLGKEAAREIRRICSLPPAERATQIAQVKAESGFVIHCGTP